MAHQFGTLYTLTDRMHPQTPKLLAAAALNGLEVPIAPNFRMGETNRTPAYIAKFPLGKIPSFESSTGFAVSETNAIGYFLCASGPNKETLLGSNAEDQATIQHFVHFTSEHLHRTVMTIIYPILGFKPYDAAVDAEAKVELKRWMSYLEGVLADGRDFLVKGGKGISYADLCVSQGLRLGFKLALDQAFRESYPNVLAWWNRVLAVPEVESAFQGNVLLEKRNA